MAHDFSHRLDLITTFAQMQEALEIRRQVFQEEQQVPVEREVDEYDIPVHPFQAYVHVLGYDGEIPVSTGRIWMPDSLEDFPKVGRVAVLSRFRRRGWGRRIMNELENQAKKRGYKGVQLAAQLQATPFYCSLGYESVGEIFIDAGIEHRLMRFHF